MAIKKVSKTVEVVKLEQKEVEEYYCDCCEVKLHEENNGIWYTTSICNGEVSNEWFKPVDLCKKCVCFYDRFISKNGISRETATERYDGFSGNKAYIVEKLIEIKEKEEMLEYEW